MLLNSHHLDYESDYTVEIPQYFHKAISIIQRTVATPELLVLVFNCQRALNFECERIARDLDQGTDTRVKNIL